MNNYLCSGTLIRKPLISNNGKCKVAKFTIALDEQTNELQEIIINAFDKYADLIEHCEVGTYLIIQANIFIKRTKETVFFNVNAYSIQTPNIRNAPKTSYVQETYDIDSTSRLKL